MGSAAKEGKPLGTVQVSLYSAGKLMFKATTNKKGEFTIGHLPLGRYRLDIEGLGSFTLQVVPPRTMQNALYSFGTINGCRYWGVTMD